MCHKTNWHTLMTSKKLKNLGLRHDFIAMMLRQALNDEDS